MSAGRTERGAILLAFMALLLVITAGALLSRASRIPNKGAADVAARVELQDVLESLRFELIALALKENNTPGTMPCPAGKKSCTADASALAGTLSNSDIDINQAKAVALGAPLPSNLCIQYVLAPSLRNFLSTASRGDTQKQVNPQYESDLAFTSSAGVTLHPWAVLFADAEANTCSLDALGYQLSTTTGLEANLAPKNGSKAAAAVPLERRDIVAGLMDQALRALDTTPFATYIATKNPPVGTRLAAVREANRIDFDSAVAAGSPLSYGSSSSGSSSASAVASCPTVSVTASSSSSSSTSSGGASKGTNAVPASWLCFNDWYAYIEYDSATGALRAFDTTFPPATLTCTRRAHTTSCTY